MNESKKNLKKTLSLSRDFNAVLVCVECDKEIITDGVFFIYGGGFFCSIECLIKHI